MDEYEELKRDMQMVFDCCITKAQRRIRKPGNTATPYNDFSTEHLESRLKDEWDEYWEKPSIHELEDIINIASFLVLSRLADLADKLEEGRP